MVVDTSALLAILCDEPEGRGFNEAIETSIVIEARFGAEGARDLDHCLGVAEIKVKAVDRDQASIARRAFSEFGKGRHPAGLDFGDCFSYALAKARGERLLFEGTDFTKTDIESAAP